MYTEGLKGALVHEPHMRTGSRGIYAAMTIRSKRCMGSPEPTKSSKGPTSLIQPHHTPHENAMGPHKAPRYNRIMMLLM